MAHLTRPIRSAAIAAALFVASPALAQTAAPNATIDLSGRSVAVGVGYAWATGTLHYNGKAYPLNVSGISVFDMGAAKFSAHADVYNLHLVHDINGVYSALEVGAAGGSGGGVGRLENDRGVQIRMYASDAGLQFKLAPEGVTIHQK
ncbi:MAG: hypothetical protein JWP50_2243 [Phenylobacterium sp.]|nr:hypothetical protein [Phenylobacterium sp.]